MGKVEKEVADLARWKGLGGRKPGKVPGLKFDLARLDALAQAESGCASAEKAWECAYISQ